MQISCSSINPPCQHDGHGYVFAEGGGNFGAVTISFTAMQALTSQSMVDYLALELFG